MSNQPNEAAIRRYRVIAVSHDQCVNTHGVSAIEDAAGALVYYGDHDAVVTRLRSALANAEKDRAASARDWEAALSAHDRRVEELNQALAKLAEAEKERDEFAEKVGELAFIRHNLTEERDALAAQLAEVRGLLGDLLAWLTSPKMQTWQYHENGFFAEDAQKFVNRLSLAPPSDRGADTQASGRAVPRETIERLGLQRYYDAPSDRGAEGSCPACGLSRCEDQGVCDGVIMSRKRASDRGTSPSASAPVEVTSEMVERACIAYVASARHHFDGSVPDTTHMRAALAAALKGKES